MCIPNIHVDANTGISFASFLVVMSFLSRSHRLSWFNQRGRRQPAQIQKKSTTVLKESNLYNVICNYIEYSSELSSLTVLSADW